MPTVHFPRPRFDLDAARAIGRERFGIEGSIRELPGERDLNFRIDAGDGSWVVKIANAHEERATLELQHAALEHLLRREPALGLQRPRRSVSGDTIVEVESAAGERHLARALSFVPGRLWADVHPRPTALLESLGAQLGAIDRGLADFDAPGLARPLKWDLAQAGWIREHVARIEGGDRRVLVERWLAELDRLGPALARLPRQAIYNDANDHNLVVGGSLSEPRVTSAIDFGDLCRSWRIGELAIAGAYAAMRLPDPLSAIAAIVRGYHAELALEVGELETLHALVCLRLSVSVTNAALQRSVEPDNTYLTISERDAWELLERLSALSPRLALAKFRHACGLPAHRDAERVERWLRAGSEGFAGVLGRDLSTATLLPIDWSVGSAEVGTPIEPIDARSAAGQIERRLAAAGALAAVGGYGEPRAVYFSEAYRRRGNDRDESRAIHLGLDLFLAAGSPVFAPLDGVVHSFADNAHPFDYGPTIVLTHEVEDVEGSLCFHTLYGHLSRAALDGLEVGRRFSRGERLGALGDVDVNGGWAPHLHLQILVDPLDRSGDFDGACLPSEWPLWRELCPDPNLIVRAPEAIVARSHPSKQSLLERRRALLGSNLSLAYREPLAIVRGARQWLWDADGQRYLDAFNNVPHVGHSHSRVVAAVARQLALLNTNTRYLHPLLLDYAERLLAHFPEPLRVCFFTASGSEANELALRLARAATGARDLVVAAGAYHGHTTGLIDISPYKHEGPGGQGAPDWVHVSPVPDTYRGDFRADDPRAGERYAELVAEVIAGVGARGRRLSAYIAETFPSVGGQLLPPDDFYPGVYEAVRSAGGLCIADEVQTGFGRTGDSFWAFERYGVVPDVVVLGKPIANGFPMGAVVTTRAIADAFANGMEFFSTFGGSTAAAAAALATLEVVEEERLQENARTVGAHLLGRLRELGERHRIVGDVRGAGLFVGVELVLDRATLEPAGEVAGHVADRMRDRGVLIGTDGAFHNVLKIRPPLCFSAADADRLAETLDLVLAEDAVRLAVRRAATSDPNRSSPTKGDRP